MKKSRRQPSKMPVFTDVNQNRRPVQMLGDAYNPRKIVSSQPLTNGILKLLSRDFFQYVSSSGGTAIFGNLPFLASAYRVRGSISTQWPGATQIAGRYFSFFAVRLKVTLTISNTKTQAVACYVTPKRAPTAGGSVGLLPDYLLPQTKSVVVGSVSGGASIKKLVHTVDVSAVYGYDITSSEATNHTTTFGTAPNYSAGLQFIFVSVDGVTLPVLDIEAVYELDLIPIFPVDLTS